MAEPGHIPQSQQPWKWRAQIGHILLQLKKRSGPAFTRADLQDLNINLGQPRSFGSASVQNHTRTIDKSKGIKGLLGHLHFSQSFSLQNRGEVVNRVVSRYLELLAERISGHGGTVLSRALSNHLNVPSLPLKLRVPTPKEYTRRHSNVHEYTYHASRCMGYRHRRDQPIGILSLTLSSHPGENQVSAPELFCLAVAASEQFYLAIKARNVPSSFTVRVMSTSKSNHNLYRVVKAEIPASYLRSLLDICPSPPSKRLKGIITLEQSRYFDMFVPGDMQKLMGAVFKK